MRSTASSTSAIDSVRTLPVSRLTTAAISRRRSRKASAARRSRAQRSASEYRAPLALSGAGPLDRLGDQLRRGLVGAAGHRVGAAGVAALEGLARVRGLAGHEVGQRRVRVRAGGLERLLEGGFELGGALAAGVGQARRHARCSISPAPPIDSRGREAQEPVPP